MLALPTAMVPGLAGQLLEALLVAGAFAAFLSTSSGLLVSTAGVLVQDVLRGSVRDFRRASLVAGTVPLLLALPAAGLPVGQVVGLAFAVAASTFCPLLVLGIWWRGLTAPGAAAGLLVGGGLSAAAVLVDAGRARRPRLAGGAARPARRLDRARRLRRDGRRLAGHRVAGARPTSAARCCACTRRSSWALSRLTARRAAGDRSAQRRGVPADAGAPPGSRPGHPPAR